MLICAGSGTMSTGGAKSLEGGSGATGGAFSAVAGTGGGVGGAVTMSAGDGYAFGGGVVMFSEAPRPPLETPGASPCRRRMPGPRPGPASS